MTFALAHAGLGWALAALAALALRDRTADARCWAWRMGILKGPLALLLAVPIAIAAPLPSGGEGAGVRGDVVAQPYAVTPRFSSRHQESTSDREKPPFSRPVEGEGESQQPQAAQPLSLPLLPASPPFPAPSSPFLPSSFLLPYAYFLGLLVVALLRVAPARRAGRPMPRVVGVLRPRVVIPDLLSPEDATMALAHEKAHIRRRDPLWAFVADAVCLGLWFAPPVWLCARAMRLESEAACDAVAVDESGASRRDYARLLLSFAGPAPANALGGPARRLARRIRMLEKRPTPLARAVAVAALALGLVALLPWRAVAVVPGPLVPPTGIAGLWPLRVSLEEATRAMLDEPGTKAEIGWSAAQEAALARHDARIALACKAYERRIADYERTHSQRDSTHYRFVDRAGEKARIAGAGGPMPWTPDQQHRLKTLALARLGSALWFDTEVSNRLRLTLEQSRSLLARENAILREAFRDPKAEKAYLPLPKWVSDKSQWLQYKIYIAQPGDRPALQSRQDGLLRPYRKNVPRRTRAQDRADWNAWTAEARRLIAREEPAALALLTDAQRETLRALSSDPASWRAGGRAMEFENASGRRGVTGPLQGFGAGLAATKIPLSTAVGLMLEEPGVRAGIGWTAAQDAGIKAAHERWEAAVNAFRAELVRRQRTQTLREAFAWDVRERRKMFDRAEVAHGPLPWTPGQERTLKALALNRFGSAVWSDPEVRNRLQLTPAQIRAVNGANDAIARVANHDSLRPHLLRPTTKMPQDVALRLKALTDAYLDAPLGQRRSLVTRIANLKRPYELAFIGRRSTDYKAASERRVAVSWAMRGESDARLRAMLTNPQRNVLDALRTNPEAWRLPDGEPAKGSRPTFRKGSRLVPDPPVSRPASVSVARARNDDRRRPHKGDVPSAHGLVKAKRSLPRPHTAHAKPMAASQIIHVEAKTLPSGKASVAGERADAWPALMKADDPVRTIANPDGTEWRVYRRADAGGTFVYEVQRVRDGKPVKPVRLDHEKGSTSAIIRHLPLPSKGQRTAPRP